MQQVGYRLGRRNALRSIIPSQTRGFATIPSPHAIGSSISTQTVPNIIAPELKTARLPHHVRDVSNHLSKHGILKINLGFTDSKSQYLQTLVTSLHKYHGHGLPITHSASQGWFWDVRPSDTNFQTENHQARSETMQEFPWHTDCSYEHEPPRYFALHVLQPDRCGGGTLSVMKVAKLSQLLSPETREALFLPEFQIRIPLEFVKQHDQDHHIVGSIFASDHGAEQVPMIRFREDIVTALTPRAAHALDELRAVLNDLQAHPGSTVHLTPADLPRDSIVILDNHRWMHTRNEVKDPARHLRRIRWNAVPFGQGV